MTARITKHTKSCLNEEEVELTLSKNAWYLPKTIIITLQFNEIQEGIFVLVIQFNNKQNNNPLNTFVTYQQVQCSFKNDSHDLSLFKSAVLAYDGLIDFFDIDSSISVFDLDNQEIATFELEDDDSDHDDNDVEQQDAAIEQSIQDSHSDDEQDLVVPLLATSSSIRPISVSSLNTMRTEATVKK